MSPLTEPTKVVLKKDPVLADPYYHNVSLLLHGDGANGSTTFVDSSSNNFTVTPSGNAQISTAQSKFGGASMYFDGIGDGLTLPASSSFNFLTNDFTFEFWMYRTAQIGSFDTIVDHNYGTYPNFTIQSTATHTQKWTLYLNGTNVVISEGSNHALNTWTHYAIVRNGSETGNITIYRDGVNVGSGTYSGNIGNSTAQLRIADASGATDYSGYIDDLRITKGVARYTSNFTPPTAPFPEVIG